MGKLTEHFTEAEFACPCCGQVKMNSEFMERLEGLRRDWGHPIRIVEGGGYRCPIYAKSEHSAHREGRAADPAILPDQMYAFIQLAMAHGFKGIGVKNRHGKFQVHIDDAANIPGIRPRPWLWTYNT